MRMPLILTIAVAVGVAALPSFAGDALSIRLIAADNETSQVSEGIESVVSVLKKSNFAFTGYRLLSSGSVALPARNKELLLGGYVVRCSGKRKNLLITIHKERTELLQTNVELRPGKPLILGGFPEEKGKLFFVFLVP